jgi:uncharacterized protein YbjT (DUF2867 family)
MVLVTGATGNVGGELVRALASGGEQGARSQTLAESASRSTLYVMAVRAR